MAFLFAQRADTAAHAVSPRVDALLAQERAAGMQTQAFYAAFQAEAVRVACALMGFLLQAKAEGRSVAAYGAAAKGNTLMNFCGVRPHLLPYVVDRNPAKQGKHMPGSRIPIVEEARLRATRPDYVLILPWNLREEVMQQLAYVREWGGRFVTAVPRLEIA
jgi:hypothetical protein